MFVVSVALAAVLIAGRGTGAPAPGATPPPVLAAPTAEPARDLDPSLRARVEALPARLREEALRAYHEGSLDEAQLEQIATDFENRNPAVRVGTVLGSQGSTLHLELFTTGEAIEVATDERTRILRGGREIDLSALLQDELVMILAPPGSPATLTIEAFGITSP